MAEIGCTSGCSCHASEDGYFSNHPEQGRRNTLISGIGSVSDPWEISFIDSEFYRTTAAEFRYPDRSLNGIQTLNGEDITIVYKTPQEIYIGYTVPTTLVLSVVGNYFVVGAAAEFQANEDVGTVKSMVIGATHDTLGSVFIAGVVTRGLATEAMILTASGYDPGRITTNPHNGNYFVKIRESTAAALDIKKLKLWVTSI